MKNIWKNLKTFEIRHLRQTSLLRVSAGCLFALGVVSCMVFVSGFARATTCDRTATNASSLDAEYAAASPGEVICLTTGDYGTWYGGNKEITITAAEGNNPVMAFGFTTGDSDLTLDGLTIPGGNINNGAHDITVKNSAFTGYLVIGNVENANIMLDHNTHNNIVSCGGCYAGRIHITDDDGDPSGVTIQNSLFRGGSSYGVATIVQAVIKNNEFDNVPAIALQYYAYGAHVTGNYIHNAVVGITAYDGLSHVLIEHNVIGTSGRGAGLEVGSDDSSVIRHNTFIHRTGCGDGGGECGGMGFGTKPGSPAGHGTIVKDNIATYISVYDDATLGEQSNNLVRYTNNVNDIVGVPAFEGTPNPTSYKGYASNGSSVARNAASDGTDIGINLAEAFSDTAAPTVTIPSFVDGDTVSDVVNVFAEADDDTGIAGVTFRYDGQIIGAEDTTQPYSVNWNTNDLEDGAYTLTAVARDTANKTSTTATVHVIVDNSLQVPARSIWQSFDTPTTSFANDYSSVELGVKFRSDLEGKVQGVRFYKDVTNTGTHVGSLWNNNGTKLASVTFTAETLSGWQEALFDEPVDIDADITYVVSYFAPNGHYSVDAGYFNSQDAYRYPLRALQSGVDGPNGVFKYGSGNIFPDNTFNYSNYWVDVVFEAPDIKVPIVSLSKPQNGATVHGIVSLEAAANDNIGVTSVQFMRGCPANCVDISDELTAGPYATDWNTSLVPDGEYTLTAVAKDAAGNQTTAANISVTVRNIPPASTGSGSESRPPIVSTKPRKSGNTGERSSSGDLQLNEQNQQESVPSQEETRLQSEPKSSIQLIEKEKTENRSLPFATLIVGGVIGFAAAVGFAYFGILKWSIKP